MFDSGVRGVFLKGSSYAAIAALVVLSGVACSASNSNNKGGGTGGAGMNAVNGAIGTGGASVGATGGTAAPSPSQGGATTSTGGTAAPTGGGGATAPMSTGATGGTGGMGAAGATSSGDAGMGAAGSAGGGGGTPPVSAGCLDGITDYGSDGPFSVQTMTMGLINFWVPMVPSGCKVPVIHLANGTGANCAVYAEALNRLATHGFLACCYEDPNTGAGDQGLMALDTALSMFPDLADMKFGSTGHSQGGQAAFTVLALAEQKYGDKMIYAGLAMEPASGFGTQPTSATWQQLYMGIKSPMFMFSGLGTDGLVSQAWVQQAYDATSPTEEAYFWTASGATHIPVPNGEEEEISVPWFRWKLLGDQKACEFFKAIPMTDTKWAQVASKNEQPCM